jgi:hypothetical protein
MNKLQGKVAVITGGTEGIGLAAAKLFVKEGAYVFITGRRQRELDEAVKAIGNNIAGVQGDVAKLADLDRLYETVKAKGKIDIVLANAGIGEFAPLGSITEELFDKLFDVNVKGALFTVQKALPLLDDGGRQFSPFSWWGSISLTLKPAELPTKCGPPPTLPLFRPGPVRDRCRPSRVGPNRVIGNEDRVYPQLDELAGQAVAQLPDCCPTNCSNHNRHWPPRPR